MNDRAPDNSDSPQSGPALEDPEAFIAEIRPPDANPREWYDEAKLALQRLESPPKKPSFNPILVLIATALFFFISFSGNGLEMTLVILGIVLVHECGHLFAMRYFGYSDTRMFFIPFFGGAVTGRKDDATLAQRTWVALAGPLPGIFVPFAIIAALHFGLLPDVPLIVYTALMWTAIINTVNLVPLLPFDGGHVFRTLLFWRSPWIETLSRGLAAAILVSSFFFGLWIIGILGVFMLLSLRVSHQASVLAVKLREAGLNIPPSLEKLPQPLQLKAYVLARELVPPQGEAVEKAFQTHRTSVLKMAYPNALGKPVGIAGTLLFLCLYAASILLGVLTVFGTMEYGPLTWKLQLPSYRSDVPRQIEYIQKHLANNSGDTAFRAALAERLWQQGEIDEALKESLQVMKENPHFPKTYLLLLNHAYSTGDIQRMNKLYEDFNARARGPFTYEIRREMETILELSRNPKPSPGQFK